MPLDDSAPPRDIPGHIGINYEKRIYPWSQDRKDDEADDAELAGYSRQEFNKVRGGDKSVLT